MQQGLDNHSPTDVAYTYNGYAPISIRLVRLVGSCMHLPDSNFHVDCRVLLPCPGCQHACTVSALDMQVAQSAARPSTGPAGKQTSSVGNAGCMSDMLLYVRSGGKCQMAMLLTGRSYPLLASFGLYNIRSSLLKSTCQEVSSALPR